MNLDFYIFQYIAKSDILCYINAIYDFIFFTILISNSSTSADFPHGNLIKLLFLSLYSLTSLFSHQTNVWILMRYPSCKLKKNHFTLFFPL